VVPEAGPEPVDPAVPDASQKLALRREKALRVKAELEARQQAMARQKTDPKSMPPATSTPLIDPPAASGAAVPPVPVPVPDVPSARRLAVAVQERPGEAEPQKAEQAARPEVKGHYKTASLEHARRIG
jgi:hypothetical protein